MNLPWKHVLRDAGMLAATLGLWRLEAAGEAGLAVVLPAAFGAALCGYLAHEWGHLLGARMAGGVVHLPASVFETFLFRFDSDRNRRDQFLAMSFGGFLATAVVVALFFGVLPLDRLAGQLTLGLTGLGVLATAVLELPPAWRVARGAPIPRGVAYHSDREGVSAPP